MPQSRFHELLELLSHSGQRRAQQSGSRHHDHLEACGQLEAPENLPNPPLGQVALHGAAQLLAGGDADPGATLAGNLSTYTHELAVALDAAIEDPGELAPPAQPGALRKRVGHGRRRTQASSDTVSRLRPLARRRFSTSRPFFVSIRTRKP